MSIFFGFFKRKEWEKLGNAYSSVAVGQILSVLKPDALHLRDTDYRAIPLSDFKQLIWKSRPMTPEEYRPQIFDCDDYACCFEADMRREWAKRSYGDEALAFGYISALVKKDSSTQPMLHAFIWQVDNLGHINFFEPQTNESMDEEIIKTAQVWG